MNIAILGGRFDPIHNGHLWVAEQVLEKRSDIDEVWIIPAAHHQWKSVVASNKDRLEMVNLVTNEKIKVSDIEIQRGGISYTVDTVKEIKQMGHTVFWVVGADIVHEFPKWEKADELLNLATFLVFPRDPYALPSALPKGFELITGEELIVTNLSSTVIRNRIKQGKTMHHFVPENVERYIKEKRLYQ